MIIFEDEDLLVVNKPAGLNTHSPSPFAGEGIYEWLKNRERRWANLAILHRLDKETSGVMVLGKTALANRALTQQFAAGTVRKKYLLGTDRDISFTKLKVESVLTRAGERYLSRPLHAGGDRAETLFRKLTESAPGKILLEAEPVTGKTHQIRVHAAAQGFPILGDTLYQGTPAARVFLHAAQISFTHPMTGERVTFSAPENFSENARLLLREQLVAGELTDAFRLVHGASDGWPGWYVDRLGDFLLSQSGHELSERQKQELADLREKFSARAVYHKILDRRVRRSPGKETSPRLVCGQPAPPEFFVRENGVRFALSFNEGYSVGLFLDQRENRRRLLNHYIAPAFAVAPAREALNVFSYTCGFSVCAARAGARVTSLDLSKKYLDWGRRNFALNKLDPAAHDFIFGDAFDWLKRLARQKRQFDLIILDPPTFSQSKERGTFQAEKDYERLVSLALALLPPRGVLFASTNAAQWAAEKFLAAIENAIDSRQRKIVQQHYAPQPVDFPISRAEPAYLKTVWLEVGMKEEESRSPEQKKVRVCGPKRRAGFPACR